MRIGIDAREIARRPTGVGRYLVGLLEAWARDAACDGHELVLYAPASPAVTAASRRFTTRIIDGSGGTWWEQVLLPAVAAGDHLDVFFSPAYSAPLRLRVPVVVAMHDLSFFAHPEWFRTREGLRRRVIARRASAKAAVIVTISEFSKQEILERLGVDPEKVRVIPPGVDSPAGAGFSQADGGARVLYVGSIFNRRHVPDLIAGAAALVRRRPGVSLDIVGDNRSFPFEDVAACIALHHAGAAVQWHKYIGDDEVAALYRGARAFAFLSEYEGLGLTPLEALRAGVPPLLLDTPVARESCGEAALYVTDTRPETVASALERLLFDDDLRGRLAAEAPRALARYDRGRAGRDTLAVLERAATPVHREAR